MLLLAIITSEICPIVLQKGSFMCFSAGKRSQILEKDTKAYYIGVSHIDTWVRVNIACNQECRQNAVV